MANLTNNFNGYSYQNQPLTQYFIQPQGMLYFINNSNELNNIPMTSNMIAALCVPEETCYIKMIQNGMPIINTYKLSQPNLNSENKNIDDILLDFDKRLKALEGNKKGGRLDELL